MCSRAVCCALVAVVAFAAVAHGGSSEDAVPEADFVESAKDLPLKKADAQKEKKIVKKSKAFMSKNFPVKKIPADEGAYEAKVTDEQKKATEKSSKDLDTSSQGKIYHAEAQHLRKDHEGSLDPNSPWNKGAAKTKAAGKAAVDALKAKFAAEKKAAAAAKLAKYSAAVHHQHLKKMKAAIARQDAWDRDAKLKADAKAAKAHKEAQEEKYDKINNKHWIKRLKGSSDPDLVHAGDEAEATLKKEQEEAAMKKLKPAKKGPHTDKPPTHGPAHPAADAVNKAVEGLSPKAKAKALKKAGPPLKKLKSHKKK